MGVLFGARSRSFLAQPPRIYPISQSPEKIGKKNPAFAGFRAIFRFD
jgi:hypothetical protein